MRFWPARNSGSTSLWSSKAPQQVPGMTMFDVENTLVVTDEGFDPFSKLTTDLDVL